MKLFNINILLSSFISILFQLLNYKELSETKKILMNLKKYIFLFVIFWLIIINNIYNMEIFKAPIAFLLIVCSNSIVFHDSFNVSINYTITSYIIVVISEILISLGLIYFKIADLNTFQQNTGLILLFTLIPNLISFLVCRYMTVIKRRVKKINDYTNNNIYKIIFIIFFLVILLLIDFKSVETFNLSTYVINIFYLILIIIIFASFIYDEFKIKNELGKIDILLNNISKYEKIIDDNRINNHEILNNLLILKSFKNKNSKKYEKILDDMVNLYNKNSNSVKNLHLLPKGIKGIIYYKIDELDKLGLNINVNISKTISSIIEKIDGEVYIDICKILSILLDNAIDSCKNSNNKNFLIDIYKENDDIVISIENSYCEEINVDNLNKKYFSTKGQYRGLGLYIAYKIVSKSDILDLKQFYNNDYFVSKLIIKYKKD